MTNQKVLILVALEQHDAAREKAGLAMADPKAVSGDDGNDWCNIDQSSTCEHAKEFGALRRERNATRDKFALLLASHDERVRDADDDREAFEARHFVEDVRAVLVGLGAVVAPKTS
jgi:hypothetical protein